LPGDLKRYTSNALRIHDAWPVPSESQIRFYTVRSPNAWKRTKVLSGNKWLFGVDDDQGALMVDLDSSTYRDLFKSTST